MKLRGWTVGQTLSVGGREAWQVDCADDGMRVVLPVSPREALELQSLLALAVRAVEVSRYPLAVAVTDGSATVAYLTVAQDLSFGIPQTAKRSGGASAHNESSETSRS